MLNNVYACCSTFVQLYNPKHSRTTYLLMATWFASIFVFHGLTIYISEYSKGFEASYYNRLTVRINSYIKIIFKKMNCWKYFAFFFRFNYFFQCKKKITQLNVTYKNANFQTSLDNTIFDQCHFENCTFRRLFMNHVLFHKSFFKYTEFSNVKTSRTEFRNSTLEDVK